MISASTVRTTTDSIRARILTSEPFIRIMNRIEQEIIKGANNGEQHITVSIHVLPTYADYKLPIYINHDKLKNVDEFWWGFVCRELAKNGYKINNTKTYNLYEVSW